MPVEKVIKWNEADQLFEPVVITAELVKRGNDIEIPMEVGPITLNPPDVIELEKHESSTPQRAMWRAKLTREVLRAEDFAQRVKNPVTVTITVSAIESETLSLVLAGSVSYSQSCTVRIEPPKPTLHWRGPPFERDDAPIEIDADGEHEIELHTWVDRYRPATNDIGHDTKGVEFTHKTEKGFDPRLFGPHPDDRPWVVAPANGPNNREHSRWLSKASLPHPDHPGKIPPVYFSVSTKAWQRGSITERIKDEVRWKEEPFLEVDVPFVLVPIRLVVELVRPEKPFCADDMTYEAALKISRLRDRKPLKNGVISWEIKAETSLGGKVSPDRATLVEASAGEVTCEYTPPVLTYKPGARYHEDLVVYHGDGADRREIGTIALLLRPAIKAQIDLKKRGIVVDRSGVVDLTAEFSASEFHGSPTIEVRNADPEMIATEAICHAEIDITCGDTPVHGDITTDEKGEFIWKLPELDEVFVKLPDERLHQLADNELPTVKLDDKTEEAIATYDDKLRGYAPMKLVVPPLSHDLLTYRMAFGANIARRPDSDYEYIIGATDLLRVTTASASSWQPLYLHSYERSLTDLGNFFLDLAGTLVTWFEVGAKSAEALAAAIGRVYGAVGPRAARIFFWLTEDFAIQLRLLGSKMLDAVRRIAARLPDSLRAMVESTAAMGQAAIDAVFSIVGMTDRGAWGSHILTPLINGMMNFFKFLGEVAWSIALAVLWLGGQAARVVFDSAGTALGPVGEDLVRRTGEALRKLGFGVFSDKDLWGQFTFAKAMEILFNTLVDKSNALKVKGTSAGAWIQSQFDWFTGFTQDAFASNHRRAVDLLDIPTAEPSIDTYNNSFMQLNQTMNQVHTTQVFVDEIGGFIDAAVLTVELVTALASTITSAGFLNPVTLAPLFTTLELIVGSFKTVGLRLPQLCLSLYWGGQVQVRYHAHTLGLMTVASP